VVSKCHLCQSSELNVQEFARDAYLMHHYSTETALSVMQSEDIHRLFQIQVPEYALKEPHLFRALMSLSASHLAYKRPAEASTWMPLAFKHHTAIIKSLRELIDNVTTENCIPVFCLSIVIGMTALASANWNEQHDNTSVPNISELIQPLILLRGTSSIFQYGNEIQSIFQDGPLSAFIDGYMINYDTREFLDPVTLAHFERIRDLISQNYPEGPLREQMIFAHDWLEKIYSEVHFTKGTANGNTCLVWKWISLIGDAYMMALKNLDEGAILLFAHFAILSKIRVFKGLWYLQAWPDQVIKAATHCIQDPDYRVSLSWAAKQAEVDFDIFPREDNSKFLVED
jgi:hypothetical protein